MFDPRENVFGGTRYLRDLLAQFSGDTRLALAGYNAGENAVIKYGGIPPYKETRDYVKKVMKLYTNYKKVDCKNAPDGVKVISCSEPNRRAKWVTSLQ